MNTIRWFVNNAYFDQLMHADQCAAGFHSYLTWMSRWADENNCKLVGHDTMQCSMEDYVVLKLKGCVHADG